jgi:putative two-component system response regulator
MNSHQEPQRSRSVLIVDDDPQVLRLLAAVMERGGLEPRPITSGRLAIEAAVIDPPDIVLLDVSMPGMSGVDVCRWFKQDDQLKNIPIIFLSGLGETNDKVQALRAGGVDYVTKPFQEEEVLARINTHLRLSQLQAELVSNNLQLEQRIIEQVNVVTAGQRATIFALAKLAEVREVRDEDTGQHIERVQLFSKILAEQIREMKLYPVQFSQAFINDLYETACLHDIGKVGIPDAILLKRGRLTHEELAEMKKHCVFGSDTLSMVLKRHPNNQFLRIGVEVARSHHEKWDGSGYPDGLQGAAIPIAARIVALADSYDAMTSKRLYHPAFSHEKASLMIHEGSGTHFDPDVVTAFSALEGRFQNIRQEMQAH